MANPNRSPCSKFLHAVRIKPLTLPAAHTSCSPSHDEADAHCPSESHRRTSPKFQSHPASQESRDRSSAIRFLGLESWRLRSIFCQSGVDSSSRHAWLSSISCHSCAVIAIKSTSSRRLFCRVSSAALSRGSPLKPFAGLSGKTMRSFLSVLAGRVKTTNTLYPVRNQLGNLLRCSKVRIRDVRYRRQIMSRSPERGGQMVKNRASRIGVLVALLSGALWR